MHSVVLADDQPVWLDALERLLSLDGLHVDGKAPTCSRAIELVEEKRPAVLVVSLELASSGCGTSEFVRRARERDPELRIVVLSAMDDPLAAAAARAVGADGWVPKTAGGSELVAAVRGVLKRSANGVSRARELKNGHKRNGHGGHTNGTGELTSREIEILSLVASGFTNAEIAERLWVTKFTVKFHLVNAYRKLGVTNRTQAARYMFEHGIAATPLDRSA